MSLLECKNLSKRFGQFEALKPTNLRLEKGSPIALIGPNALARQRFSAYCAITSNPAVGTFTFWANALTARTFRDGSAACPRTHNWIVS